jgi:rSAM/selenodomain-associated transferase 1
MGTRSGLIVFAREPIPGRVKTRLAASVGDIAAAELYELMLQDVLNTSRQLGEVETIVFWDCEVESLAHLARRYSCCSKKQSGGDLGQRMQAAFGEMFASGYDACCIIGSDAPDLPFSYIQQAFDRLTKERVDAVFGPCDDGGYYLMGMSRLWPQLFENIDWSTSNVLRESLAEAVMAGCKTSLLPEWYDIDNVDDLEKYRARSKSRADTGVV